MAKAAFGLTGEDPLAFVASVPHPTRRADAERLLTIMGEATGEAAEMWSANIVGFGRYHYRYDSGREGESPLIAFSPRSASLSLYLVLDFPGAEELLAQLGKHRTGVVCLYVNKLADVDESILKELILGGLQSLRSS